MAPQLARKFQDVTLARLVAAGLVLLERVWHRPVELRALVEGKTVYLRFEATSTR